MLRATIRRHFYFSPDTSRRLGGRLVGAGAWDTLRKEQTEPSFGIPDERETWQSGCGQQRALIERGGAIATLAREVGAAAVTSVGVGTGCLEYQIHRADPRLPLHLSDFGDETVRRLDQVFPEAVSINVLDVLEEDVPVIDGGLTILHRIDTEFNDKQLRSVLIRLHDAGHRLILLVPSAFLSPRELAAEAWRRIKSRTGGRSATFVGYLRTRAVYETFWSGVYQVRQEGVIGGADYILLESTGGQRNR